MNTAVELIERCASRGIQLSKNGDKLRVVPASKVTPALKEALIQHKPDILAALAHEDATEYMGERVAVCVADNLPPVGIRPVFEYRVADNPAQPLILLGAIGDTLADARASLYRRFGDRLLSVKPYCWPPAPEIKQ